MKLTIKQEKFCQVYVTTGNASEAYRQSYSAENTKPEVIYIKASELLKNGKVAVRVVELQKEIANKELWTREMSVKGLMKAFKIGLEMEQPQHMVNAVKALNAMHGWDKQVVDHVSSDGSMSPAKSYTPEEYAQAQAKLSKELSDLD